jgi:branched-chain amino acid transport system substrate-binding protein
MMESDRMRFVRARRTVGVAVVALLALTVAACSNSRAATTNSTNPPTSANDAALLGPVADATGTPVRVGLITDGGACSGCGAGDEAPVAQATVAWLNQHMNGLAGHPMTLDVCVDNLDPGTASDCANQMIRDKDVAVVIGTDGVIQNAWTILHSAHIPVINVSATNSTLLADSASTFLLNGPNANVIGFPIGVAKDKGAKKVSVIVVDLPIATDIYKTSSSTFKKNGISLQVVPVPLVTPDMTPQAQLIESANPHGVVFIVGDDQFCIPALKGLQAVGFQGTTAMIAQCLSSATRSQVPGSVLKGTDIESIAPVGDSQDESMRQYQAILNTYASKANIDPTGLVGIGMLQSFGALTEGTKALQGAVTPQSIITAMKTMNNAVLPGSGGRFFRCNGAADPTSPSVCSNSVVVGTLNAQGNPVQFKLVENTPIGTR